MNTGLSYNVTGRLAWINTPTLWNDINANFATALQPRLPAWIGLKSKTGADTRPDLYWTDNNGAAAIQLTFGVDSVAVGGRFNIGPSPHQDCVQFSQINPGQWKTDQCSDTYPTGLCELVCDDTATPPSMFSNWRSYRFDYMLLKLDHYY